jgi:hypothetical protein
MHCFHKAAYKKLKTSLNSITMATVIILTPKAESSKQQMKTMPWQ